MPGSPAHLAADIGRPAIGFSITVPLSVRYPRAQSLRVLHARPRGPRGFSPVTLRYPEDDIAVRDIHAGRRSSDGGDNS